MAIYKEKNCEMCFESYIPTSPKQKFCDNCKKEGRKISDRKRDLKRYRIKNNYKEYTKQCRICGVLFKTHYSKKIYCGSVICEKERKLNKFKTKKIQPLSKGVDMDYLTEDKLAIWLSRIFPNENFIRDRKVIDSGIRKRADFCSYELKLIVEFDGWRHYTDPFTIIKDEIKDKCYGDLGFVVVHVPYFIQMSSIIIKNLFNIEYSCIQGYQHGFIDEKALLPANFCGLGIDRFKKDLILFDYVAEDIIVTLKNKILMLGDKRLVLPPALYNIIN